MSFPRYPKYRDSGVAWLGEVPEHWEIKRFKRIFRERDARSVAGEELLLSVSSYTGVSPRSEIIEEGEHLTRAESLEGYKLCRPNDLVMNIMLAWNRGLAFSAYHGMVSPAYSVFEVIDGCDPWYLNYVVRSNEYTRYFKAFSAGVIDSRLRLYPDTFGQLSCGVPPISEQGFLVAFLDRETSNIDALIEEQQRLITVLKEKRRAVITHAVTRGLNPDTPSKASGVEWLGDVPAHWNVTKLGRELQASPCYGVLVPDFEAGGVPMLRITDMVNGTADRESLTTISAELSGQYGRTVLEEGDVALSVVGTIGEALLVGPSLAGVNLSRAVARLRVGAALSAEYLTWYFRSMSFQRYVDLVCVGTAQRVLNMSDLVALQIVRPPLAEQGAIVNHVRSATREIEKLIAHAEYAVALLHERRSALISAAVTGKIDIRGLVDDAA